MSFVWRLRTRTGWWERYNMKAIHRMEMDQNDCTDEAEVTEML